MTPERYNKIVAVLNRRQPDLTVITDHVHKGQNLSAIIRTCDAVGIQQVHAVYETGHFGAHTGTAMGSHKWVETEVYPSVLEPITALQKQGYQVVAADLGENAVDYRTVDYCVPTAIVFGAEKEGVSEAASASVDQHIIVPMMGMVASFNVSVACAVILAEAQRQRELAGMYAARRLSDEAYHQSLFEWCQPVVARYCQRKGIAYPPLTEEGEVADTALLQQCS